MYALKFYGMFIRATDGLMTSNKSAAMLFDDPGVAAEYVAKWRTNSGVQHDGHEVEIVEVLTKPTIARVIRVIRKL